MNKVFKFPIIISTLLSANHNWSHLPRNDYLFHFVLIFFIELIGMSQWSLKPSLVRELKGNAVRRKPTLRLPPQL